MNINLDIWNIFCNFAGLNVHAGAHTRV